MQAEAASEEYNLLSPTVKYLLNFQAANIADVCLPFKNVTVILYNPVNSPSLALLLALWQENVFKYSTQNLVNSNNLKIS